MVATPSAVRATTPPFLYSLSVSEIPFGFAYADCDYPYFLLVVPFYFPIGMCFLLFHHEVVNSRTLPTNDIVHSTGVHCPCIVPPLLLGAWRYIC